VVAAQGDEAGEGAVGEGGAGVGGVGVGAAGEEGVVAVFDLLEGVGVVVAEEGEGGLGMGDWWRGGGRGGGGVRHTRSRGCLRSQ